MPADDDLALPPTQDLLQQLWKRMPSHSMSGKSWTRWFQETAADLVVQNRPHFGCCGRGKAWAPEYLADATVSKDRPDAVSDDPFGYTRLVLAVETEWSTQAWAREYDFCKLADIRASRKLFACAVSKGAWKSVVDRVVCRFAQFWDQHDLVETGEEVGMMFTTKDEVGAWVLRKGSVFVNVPLTE